MKTKVYIFSLAAIGLFALASLITVVGNTSPTTIEVIVTFYLSIFVFIFVLVSLAILFSTIIKMRIMPSYQTTLLSVRIGVIVSLLAIAVIFLSSQKVLSLPIFIALLVISFIFELLWRRYHSRKVLGI